LSSFARGKKKKKGRGKEKRGDLHFDGGEQEKKGAGKGETPPFPSFHAKKRGKFFSLREEGKKLAVSHQAGKQKKRTEGASLIILSRRKVSVGEEKKGLFLLEGGGIENERGGGMFGSSFEGERYIQLGKRTSLFSQDRRGIADEGKGTTSPLINEGRDSSRSGERERRVSFPQ